MPDGTAFLAGESLQLGRKYIRETDTGEISNKEARGVNNALNRTVARKIVRKCTERVPARTQSPPKLTCNYTNYVTTRRTHSWAWLRSCARAVSMNWQDESLGAARNALAALLRKLWEKPSRVLTSAEEQ